jgi:hypothetical protein
LVEYNICGDTNNPIALETVVEMAGEKNIDRIKG